MFFSVIIPVYNRPDEIDELLDSLTKQTYDHFEVIIVEDGSTNNCEAEVGKYASQLDITYYSKPNSGQGFSRNYGFERAKGEYFVVFDSDCLIPEHYFETVHQYLSDHKLDAYGGPDRALKTFTPTQRAISYSMTSLFTTGGIRGGKKRMGAFHPRSFNMGISKEVFEKTNGYIITRMGEDIEFSIRIIDQGFKTGLVEDAYVYHKRRTSLKQFYKQLHFFGRARINISRFYPGEIKLVHLFPVLFTLGFIFMWLLPVVSTHLFLIAASLVTFYFGLIFLDSLFKEKNLKVAVLSVGASFTQLFAYGVGFLQEGWRKITKK
ncbi:glycosyltransferase [Fulvivirga sediminis]|uniref:Glycosyltransferase n=1 Tax=Fulvivirga sediminis TaxID=2803949 RepID=A0A937K218_9BACT|nr:glycosyltransferase [Fulvivirga sediminis]MBL3658091.1 glycosyltransferase [Fulvivirga sediminis]